MNDDTIEDLRLARKDALHNALSILHGAYSAEELVEVLANVLFHAAAKAFAARQPEDGASIDRIAQYLDAMQERFENEDSSQEERSYYDV